MSENSNVEHVSFDIPVQGLNNDEKDDRIARTLSNIIEAISNEYNKK